MDEPMNPRTALRSTCASEGPKVPGQAKAAALSVPYDASRKAAANSAAHARTPPRSRSIDRNGATPASVAASKDARGETSNHASRSIVTTPTANAHGAGPKPTIATMAVSAAAATALLQ